MKNKNVFIPYECPSVVVISVSFESTICLSPAPGENEGTGEEDWGSNVMIPDLL